MYRRLKRDKERQEAFERAKAKELEEKKEDPPVDENGVIEHQVDFLATISDKAKSNSWEEEDSYLDYGEEFADYNSSDYYDSCANDSDLDGEGVTYDIEGNVIPRASSCRSAR